VSQEHAEIGFTLDIIDCLERFGETIDWAMIILQG
jgi:hypothetical protein